MKSVKHAILLVAVIAMCGSMVSCKAIKKFLNTDLSDEEYIVGQLYADEYVKEKPVQIARRSDDNTGGNASSKTGIELNDKDNRKLYAAIDKWYGTPYQYGGCSTSGVDCSCFVDNIYKTVYGITLNRIAADIQKNMSKMVGRNELREG
ncbi:MAG: C40 family peptidase, partial [Bacteroidales bacterium]|nr:C40 family peptidase [Bacteroidales bacterium]